MSVRSAIGYVVQEQIGYISLRRPEKRNALSNAMLERLGEVFEAAAKDSGVKVLVLRGQGKDFCAGADLEDLRSSQHQTFEENLQNSGLWKETFLRMYRCPKLLIGEVGGAAMAGGCGLVSVCDVVYCSEEAFFGCPEVHIGFVPALILVFLLHRIGAGGARELLLTGRRIDALRAQQLGLVQAVVPLACLEGVVQDFAREMVAKNAAEAMQVTKDLFHRVQGLSLEDALETAAEVNARARTSAECKRGIQAFLDKKPLDWTQR